MIQMFNDFLKVKIIHLYCWIAMKLKDPLVEWRAINIKEHKKKNKEK